MKKSEEKELVYKLFKQGKTSSQIKKQIQLINKVYNNDLEVIHSKIERQPLWSKSVLMSGLENLYNELSFIDFGITFQTFHKIVCDSFQVSSNGKYIAIKIKEDGK
jgi:hypothetical protein